MSMLIAVSILENIKGAPCPSISHFRWHCDMTCLASHLKRDILQPQPICDNNPAIAPAILPRPIINFLGAALGNSTAVMDNCWEILQDYAWESPIVPLMSEDFKMFKRFGWPCRALSILAK